MRERGFGDDFAIILGVSLILLGALVALTQLLGVRVIQIGWPLFVLGPGLAITAAAFASPPGRGLGYLAVPGAVITVTGLVLEVQASTGDWQSWSYAWALVAPGGVGLGFLLAGIHERSRWARTAGGVLLAAAAALFVFAEWFFVRVAEVGGPGLGWGFGLVFPALVITFGLLMIARGIVRRG
ncbi:MAG: hypothetical protein WBJ62_01945 [Coriobacteriia bacterium]